MARSGVKLSPSCGRATSLVVKHRPKLTVLLALLLCALSPRIFAQTLPPVTSADQVGTQPYGSYHGGDVDSIGLTNGTLSLDLPILSYPQRGNLHVSFNLMYNNQPQHFGQICFPPPDPCEYDWDIAPLTGAAGNARVVWADSVTVVGQNIPYALKVGSQTDTYYYGNWFIEMADGSKHVLGNQGTVSWSSTNGGVTQLQTSTGPFETLDATGWRTLGAETTTPVNGQAAGTPTSIINPSGVKYLTNKIQDPSGNLITYNSTTITDSVGRQIPLPSNTSSTSTSACPVGLLPVSSATLWAPPGYNGTNASYIFCYAQVVPNMQGTTIGSLLINGGIAPFTGLQSIVLPNGQTWQFEYNDTDATQKYNGKPVTYGTLSKITLPTGGTITYTYTGMVGGNPKYCQNGGRWVASRTVNANDGTGNQVWSYNYAPTGVTGTVVTDPLLNDTVHVLSGSALNCATYESQTQFYQGKYNAGTLVKTVTTNFGFSTASRNTSPNGYINRVPTSIVTTWPNGGTSEVTKSYDSGFSYRDYYGNTTDLNNSPNVGIYGKEIGQSEYDYPSGTSLLRTTNTSYVWQSPNPNYSSYLTNNLLNLPYSVQIKDGGGTQRAYTYYGYDESTLQTSNVTEQKVTGESYPGNQTSVHRSLNAGTFTCPDGSSGGTGGYLLSKTTYFDTGKVATASDPCSHSTTYAYSNANYYGAYPTTITNALGQQTTNAYDINTGLLTSTTDPNQLATTYSYDSMWRLSQINHPDGAQDTITRQETTFPFTATSSTQVNSAESKIETNVFDGLGRLTHTQLTSDPQGTVYTDTAYDGLGRVATVSNPYRTGTDPSSSPGTTTYTYDPVGRKTKLTYPDSSVLTTAYCGPNTLVTDPAAKWRRSRVNGLGQLVEVDEPNSTTATVASTGCPGTGEQIWVTSYTNDPLGNLTQVVQNGSHIRTFTYDTISRLLTAANPENGTITYTYNPDNTLLAKTDARAITTCYGDWSSGTSSCTASTGYDALHRVLKTSYSNSDPSLTFTYDGTGCLSLSACQNIGHRTGMTDGAGSELWAYEVDKTNLRSVHREQRTTNSTPSNITKTTTYYLDFVGNVTQLVYPTGRTVNYTYDAADRPSTASDSANGITYATDWETPVTGCLANAVCYTPQGSVYNMSIGQTSSFTGFNLSLTFNNRLQPNEIKASSTVGTAIDDTYSFVDPTTTHNAGHVYKITNNLTSGRTQSFTYDQLNRITTAGTTATTGSTCWGYQYTYDAWGNLLSQAGWTPTYNACTEGTMGPVTADGNNHISGLSYDSSGNTQTDGSYTYIWDGESQLKTAGGLTYNYDGDGRRVAKVGSKLYWYGSGGEILAETDTSGNTQNEYIFFGGRRVAMVPGSGSALYYAEDLLGSSRVIVQSNGALCYDGDFTPFGGERPITSTCAQNYKFEGKERDTETGNDDFDARYYSWRFGRWLSSDWSEDPEPIPYADLTNPQTLNLYAMVTNDPESFADLDGHDADAGAMESSASPTSSASTAVVPVKPAPLVIDRIVINVVGTAARAAGATVADVIGGIIVGALYLISPQGGDYREAAAEHRAQQRLAEKQAKEAKEKEEGSDESEAKAAAGGSGKKGLPPGARKLRGGQGYRDKDGNIWKKDKLHKDHWDVVDSKGNKIKEITFDGRQLWPNGPKNKNK